MVAFAGKPTFMARVVARPILRQGTLCAWLPFSSSCCGGLWTNNQLIHRVLLFVEEMTRRHLGCRRCQYAGYSGLFLVGV